MLSPQSKYAIRALMYLRNSNDIYHQVAEIAKKTNLPSAFLSKITKTLVENQILISKRGKNGGIKINSKFANTSFFEICLILDEPFTRNDCVLFSKECDGKNPCLLHQEFTKSKSKLIEYLKNEKI